MRKIQAIMLGLALVSCNQTRDFLTSLNEAPRINFTDNPNIPVLTDSIKLSFKNSQVKYPMTLKVTDRNNNISEILYTQIAGTGTLQQEGIDIVNNNISFRKDSSILKFDYFPTTLGLHRLGIEVRDNFGLSNSVTIDIIAFDNLPPVAVDRWTRRGVFGEFHYEIRATESFDRDKRFGGAIEEYEYKARGVIRRLLATTEGADKFQVIFDQRGVYPYEVRVRDNDGRWSDLKKGDIVVN